MATRLDRAVERGGRLAFLLGGCVLASGIVVAQEAGPPVGAEPVPKVLPPVQLPAVPAPPTDERRLPALGSPLAGTPKSDPKVDARFGKFVDQLVDPEKSLDLVVGRSRLMVLKGAPKRVQVGDSKIADAELVTASDITLSGHRPGTTVLTLWFADPDRPGRDQILSYLVRVFPDPEQRDRADRTYAALADEINRAFHDSAVQLKLVGDKLVVSGHAKDVEQAYQILRVARANAPQGPQSSTVPVGVLNVTVPPDAAAAVAPEVDEVPTLGNLLKIAGPNVINQLRIAGEQQVMLRVTVAEVNRSAARSIGLNFSLTSGDFSFASLTGTIAGVMNPAGNLIQVQGSRVNAAVNALKTLDLARTLDEPNLVTLNGRPASFLTGGSFPVPVVTGATAVGLQGVQFVPFGVSLQFTPVITDRDRVRIQVEASVSARDLSTSQTNINGANVPSLTQRTFQTTVELRDGQTMAVAGLIQANLGADSQRIPFLADIPVAGRLFSSDRTQNADQELVVLITPELVRPVEPCDVLPLPGEELVAASDVDFYLHGDLVAPGPTAVRVGPAMPADRRAAVEQKLLIGPSGYCPPK